MTTIQTKAPPPVIPPTVTYEASGQLEAASTRPDGTATFGTGDATDGYFIMNTPDGEFGLFGHIRTEGTPWTVTGLDADGTLHATIAAAGAQSATRALFSLDYSATFNSEAAMQHSNITLTFKELTGATTEAGPKGTTVTVYPIDESFTFSPHTTTTQTGGPKGPVTTTTDAIYGTDNHRGGAALGAGDWGTSGSNRAHFGDSYNPGFEGHNNLTPGEYQITLTEHAIGTTGVGHTMTVDLTLT